MKKRNLFLLPAIALATPCFAHSETHLSTNYFDIDNGNVHVHAEAAPDAIVTPDGSLSIAGKAITVTDAQQKLLRQYHKGVVALRDHAYETGMAGADIAGDAIALAVSAIAGADTDKADKKINAKADKIEASATRLCADFAGIRATQDSITQQLPAFQPYARIDADAVAKCHSK